VTCEDSTYHSALIPLHVLYDVLRSPVPEEDVATVAARHHKLTPRPVEVDALHGLVVAVAAIPVNVPGSVGMLVAEQVDVLVIVCPQNLWLKTTRHIL